MIKRENIEKMLVSTNGSTWCERYVIFVYENGSCMAVDKDSEVNFENGRRVEASIWRRYTPIPKKEMRYMTREEILLFLLDNPKTLVRETGTFIESTWMLPALFKYTNPMEYYEYIFADELRSGEVTPKKFMVEV